MPETEDIVTRLRSRAAWVASVSTEQLLYEAATTIATLRADAEELRRDAERYRWLRESKAGTIRLDGDHNAPSDFRWASPQYLHWGDNLTLDAAIDAAKAKEGA